MFKYYFVIGVTVMMFHSTAMAEEATIPAEFLGVWAKEGECTNAAQKITIAQNGIKMGKSAFLPIVYVPDDDGQGNGALHWAEEGVVDNFVYYKEGDYIRHNTQGYNMLGAEYLKQCKK